MPAQSDREYKISMFKMIIGRNKKQEENDTMKKNRQMREKQNFQ